MLYELFRETRVCLRVCVCVCGVCGECLCFGLQTAKNDAALRLVCSWVTLGVFRPLVGDSAG